MNSRVDYFVGVEGSVAAALIVKIALAMLPDWQ